MNPLIVSSPVDLHGVAVAWGLRKLGLAPVIWRASDFPKSNLSSFSLDNAGSPEVDFTIHGQPFEGRFSSIWWRRKASVAPMESSHPHDIKIIKSESESYLQNVFAFLSHQDCLWVNSLYAARRADNKTLQLIRAREAGFRIPNTLITNDAARLRAFYEANGGCVIYKAFNVGGWMHENGNFSVLKTSALREQDMENDEVLQSCPGIYQERIGKDFELRVTVFGNTVVTGMIASQSQGETLDWRYDYMQGHTTISAFALPTDVKGKCLALCRSMGLEFACIDLIVTPAGEYVFLELNEAGQFLWKEQADPQMRMLDMFCQYLAGQGRVDYNAVPGIDMATFMESSDYMRFLESTATSDPASSPLVFEYTV